MARSENDGRLGEEFFTPGNSSFTEFLSAHRPQLLNTRLLLPEGVRSTPDDSRTAPPSLRSPTATA
jgi:proteasome beta subunit